MTSDDSRERVAWAARVAQDSGPASLAGRVGYALYLTAILALIFGHSVVRAVVVVLDPAAAATVLWSWPALAAGVVLVGLSLRVARRIGRRRGPAVPPLPWVDVVVAGPVDRADALRGWWWQSAAGLSGLGLIAGGTVGGALWTGGAAGPLVFALASISGAGLGFVVALRWLSGQAEADPSVRSSGRPWTTALRGMTLTGLRAQAVRAALIDQAVFAGDARAVQLGISSPVTAGRHLRLAPGRPMATMIRRDMLGLRRSPGAALTGVVLAVLAGIGAGTLVALPRPNGLVAGVVALLGHGAFRAVSEGLRQQADRGVDTGLVGSPPARELLAHLPTPALLSGVPMAVAGLVVAAPAGAGAAAAASLASLGLSAIVTGVHSWSAFRGPCPLPAYQPNGRAWALGWYAVPTVLSAVAGGVWMTRLGSDPGLALLGVAVAPVALTWGLRLAVRHAAFR